MSLVNWGNSLSPIAATGKAVSYPIKLVGSQYINAEKTMDASALWRLQQIVFRAKMDALQYILTEDCVPAGESDVEIVVRVRQRAIDSEATDGKWIELPVDMHAFMAYKLDKPIPKV